MTSVALQATAVAFGGGGLLAVTISLTRRGRLSLRYGLGWMSVAVAAILCSVLLRLVVPFSRALHISPTGFLLGASSTFLLLLALQLSVSVSGLQDAVRDLSEANALLEERVQKAEQRADAAEGAPR